MSTTIDQRVVEMTFDNKNFESNVKTSLSTLDKLKKALKFDGASKGLEDIQNTSKKINLSPMLTAADNVTQKFSYMQMTIQHQLNNIVDSALNTGKRVVSALTIDPVKTGFQEYETQINSVQTILANTSHNGTTLDEVNNALDTLNKYADMTIYNFTEMTRNIGTFTAAGVDLQTSVDSIQGIANLAAVSGSTSQQASTAMYQLSQALAAGKVSLMDWNSVVNAGMGGKVFQDALIRTSELLNTGAQSAINTYGSFRESLTQGEWLTTEVLTETLKQFAGAYSEADLIAQGFTKSQAKEIAAMAVTATDAATKVKTFTQLWDTLKEATQSGWTQTWELIIGDFEEAKELLTGISDSVGGFINKVSESRNKLLGSALGKSFSNLSDKINKVLEPAKKMADSVQEVGKTASKVTDTIADLGNIVDDVIIGKFGNGKTRYDKLTESGYNWMRVQNKVNEKLGNSKRYTEEQIAAQDKLIKTQSKTTESTKNNKKATTELTEEQKSNLKQLAKMTDEQLKQKGYTDEQIKTLKELKSTASKLGIPFDEFIDKLDEINGRWLLINSFKNVGTSIVKIFSSIGHGFREIFEPIKPDQLFDAIAGLHKFTAELIPTEKTCEKISRIFKGLFSVLHLVSTIAGGALKIGFTLLTKILGAFGTDVLGLIAYVADIITGIHNWIIENSLLAKILDRLIGKIPGLVEKFKGWLSIFKETPVVQKFLTIVTKIKTLFESLGTMKFDADNISKWTSNLITSFLELLKTIPDVMKQLGKSIVSGFDSLTGGAISKIINFFTAIPATPELAALAHALSRLGTGFKELVSPIADLASDVLEKATKVGHNIIEGLQNGLSYGVGSVVGKIVEIATNIINAFCDMLGIHSPSTVAFSWGKFIVMGLALGMLSYIGLTSDAGQKIINSIKDAFDGSKLQELIYSITDKLNLEKIFDFTDKIKEQAAKIEWDKVFLGGVSIALYSSLNKVLDIVKNLTSPLEGISNVLESFSGTIETVGKAYAKDKNREALMKTAIAIGVLVAAIALLVYVAGDNYGQIWNAVGVIAVIAGVLAGLSVAMDKLGTAAVSISNNGIKIGSMKTALVSLGVAIVLMAVTAKIISGMDPETAKQGFIGLAGMMVAILSFISLSSRIAKNGGDISSFGKTMKQMAVAMLLMLAVIKLSAMMDDGDLVKGFIVIEAFVLIAIQMGIANRIAGGNAVKFGKTMKQMAVAMALMTGVIWLVSKMDPADIIIGIAVIEAFVLIAIQMGIANRIAGGEATKFGGTMLKMAIAIGIMTGVVYLLSKMNYDTIIKGVLAVQVFVLLIAEMLLIAKIGSGVNDIGATVISMALAIGILAGVCILISGIDVASLTKGIIVVGILSLFMSGMIYAARGVENNMGSIIALSVAIGIMVGAVWLLSLMNTTKLATSVAALSALMIAFGAMSKLSSGIQGSTGLIGGLATMMIAVVMLSALLFAIDILDIQGSIETVSSISVLLLAMAASCKILSGIQSVSSGAFIAMGVLTLVVTALALVLWGIDKLDVQANLPVVMSLSILLLAMSGVTVILSTVGAGATSAIMGAVGLVGVISVIGAFMIALGALVEYIPQVQTFLDNGIPVLKSIGEGIGQFIGGVIGGIGAGICDQLPGMGKSIKDFVNSFVGIDSSALDGVKTLAEVIAVIGGAAIVDGIAGLLNFSDQTPMEQFKTNALGLVDVMVAVSNSLSGVSINNEQIAAVAKAGELFATLANSIPSTDGLLQKLTGVKDLGSFGTSISEFVNELKIVNDAIGSNYVFNTEAFTAFNSVGISFSDLINSIPSTDGWLQTITGVKDLGNFGIDISTFIGELKTVNDAIGTDYTFNTEAFTAFKTVGMSFSSLVNSIPATDGWLQTITGIKDLGTFGADIKTYVEQLKMVNDAIGPDYTFNEDAFKSLKSAGEKMAELQSSLTGLEGVIGWFKGQQDLGDFGTNIGYYADGISKLSDITITEDKISAITNAGNAILALNDALPEEGFFDKKITMTDFAEYIADFAEAIANLASKTVDLNPDSIDTAITAAYRIRTLISTLSDLDTSGVSEFTGVGTGGIGADGVAYDIACAIAEFGKKVSDIDTSAVSTSVSAALKIRTLISNLIGLDYSGVANFKPQTIGAAMKAYADKVTGIETSTVSNSINAANRLRLFISSLSSLNNSGISKFKPGYIGTAIKNYVSSIGKINISSILISISGANKLKNFINSLAGLDTSGVLSFKTAISNLTTVKIDDAIKALNVSTKKMPAVGSNIVKSLSNGLNSKTPSLTNTGVKLSESIIKGIKSKANTFQINGVLLMTKLITGLKSKNSQISSTMISAISSSVTSIRSKYGSMYSAGKYLGEGLVYGINAKKSSAWQAGYNLGKAAVEGEKAGQQSNSPSKLTIKAGKWLGEGLVIGIGRMTKAVYSSGANLGETATKALSSAISNVTDLIDTGIDTSPTIRPVLDLRDIDAGVNTMSNMLDVNSSVGVMANVGAISSMMSNRNQNGNNDDVVYAINKLSKQLGKIGGNTYNVNGVTYDDGSNISDAVEAIVRAARVERRI